VTVTDPQSRVVPTHGGLADLLAAAPAETWYAPSLGERYGDDRTDVGRHRTLPAETLTVESRASFRSSPESRHTHAAPIGRTA
jgi:hypothetical protein